MQKRIKEWIEQYHMIEPGETVLLGLSGGVDSVYLFHVLCRLRKELSFSLQAVHVHHNLRGAEADRDAAFAEKICKEEQVPFFLYSCEVKKLAEEEHFSVEEAGRMARQRAFSDCMEQHGADRLALAHHQNDAAETMLHHLARGTSLLGLASLRPVRGKIIRPLLCMSRQEIQREAEKEQLLWCEDGTNQEDLYTRNGIRHHVMPYLTEEINQEAPRHMMQVSLDLMEAEEYLEQQAKAWYDQTTKEEKTQVLFSDAFFQAVPLLQRYGIRMGLLHLSQKQKDLTREHIESVQRLWEKQTGKQVDLPYQILAERRYNGVLLKKKDACAAGVDEDGGLRELLQNGVPLLEGIQKIGPYEVKISRKTYIFPERFEENKYTKCFDCAKIKSGLVLRKRRSGDYLTVTADGGRKKLKNYMIDAKIPREQRDTVPLIADGPEILWAIGYRKGESCRIGPDTRQILAVEVTRRKKS